jgi:6-phosphofructokinase 1
MSKRNAFYAQSGGVTAVINASACGVIETARRHRNVIGKVYAGRNGIIGALREELIDISKESARAITGLRNTPSGAFGSCRDKLQPFEKDPREYQRLIEVSGARHRITLQRRWRLADTANKVAQFSAKPRHRITRIGVPKTVDNDLPFTDTCPDRSVAKYVAVSIREALDVASMCETSTKVFVMDRDATRVGCGRRRSRRKRRTAHRISYFPEIAFERRRSSRKWTNGTPRRLLRDRVEGARRADGTFVRRAPGRVRTHAPGARADGGEMVRESVINSISGAELSAARGSLHRVRTDVEQAYAVGRAAVEFAVAGKNAVMPIIAQNGRGRIAGRSAKQASKART